VIKILIKIILFITVLNFNIHFGQNVKFEYKVEHKFDIVNCNLIVDSLQISHFSKIIDINQTLIKKDSDTSKFYIELCEISCDQKDKLTSYFYHIGYSIKGDYNAIKNSLSLKYSNFRTNYKESIYDYIRKKHSTYSFKDIINLSNNNVVRKANVFITENENKNLDFIKLTSQTEEYKIYVAKRNNEQMIIKTRPNLPKEINPNFFHDILTEGIEYIEKVDYKLTLSDYKITN
jgi:hypothetical protein